MANRESALREVRKLKSILTTHGNCLVPTLPDQKETYAHDRLIHFVEYLTQEEQMTLDEIDIAILEIDSNKEPLK